MKYKDVYVFGPNPFNSRLLADHIRTFSSVSTTCICEISEISENDLNPFSLFLCDCSQTEAKSYCRKIHRNGFSCKEAPDLALLNVVKDEELTQVITSHPIQGVFYKSDHFELIEKGIKSLLKGDCWLPRELLVKCLNATRDNRHNHHEVSFSTQLTMREREILKLISSGLSNQAIAERLYISPNTVKTHISNIYNKIDCVNRVQAIIWAAENLFLTPMDLDQMTGNTMIPLYAPPGDEKPTR